jgi:hypothetical protein
MSLLLIVACALLFLAAFGFGWGKYPGLHFGWLGMACWCLSILLPVPRVGVFHPGLAWLIVVVLVIWIVVLLVRPRMQ